MTALRLLDVDAHADASGGEVGARLSISVATEADGAGRPTSLTSLEFAADGEVRTFALADATASGGALRAWADWDKETGVLGLGPADMPFDALRLEVRPDRPEAGWSLDAPYAALTFPGDIEAATGAEIPLVDGTVEAGAAVALRVRVSFALVAPPDVAAGLSNMAVRLDIPDLGIGSGWVPLSVLDPGGLDDLDMPGLLRWFGQLIPSFEVDPNLPALDWDVDLRVNIDLPLGLRVRDASFAMRRDGSAHRIALDVSGLVLVWDGAEVLASDTFALSLVWSGGRYLVEAQLFAAQYPRPDATGTTLPFAFALPLDLLRAEADAVLLRLGLFGHDDASGTTRFCFDALLEVGGLALSSALSGGAPFHRTDLRLHMRDLRLMTGTLDSEVPLFEGARGEANVFAAYRALSSPLLKRQSFGGDLRSAPEEGPANDTGVEFLDGAFSTGAHAYIAWQQSNVGRILTALSHEVLGTAPAGALPDDAARVTFALELAWFDGSGAARDVQLRLDMRAQTAPGSAGAEIAFGGGGTCFGLDDIGSGLVLPGGPVTKGDLGLATTGVNPIGLSLPGLELKVRRPDVHSLVLRRGGEGAESAAWLVSWEEPVALSKGDALAEASIDFSFAPASGPRQVQPARGGRFLRAVVGQPDGAGTRRALELVGWSDLAGTRFLRAFDAGRDFAILPAPDAPIGTPTDACPPASDPAPPPVPFSPGRFRDFALSDDGADGFLLGLEIKVGDVLLNQFGDAGVTFKIKEICLADPADALIVRTCLRVPLAGNEGEDGDDERDNALTGELDFRLRLSDLALSAENGARLALRRKRVNAPGFLKPEQTDVGEGMTLVATVPYALFGFELHGLAAVPESNKPDDVELFVLTLEDGTFRLETPESTQLLLRYADFGDEGLMFTLDRFALGAGGLDLSGEMLPTTLKLPGLQKPFALETARIEVVGGRMTELSIAGSGNLPELLDDAPVSIAATLRQDERGRVRLADLDCSLGDGTAPIFSRGTKCRFELTQITIDNDDADGTRPLAWFFRISGSMQMKPDGAEFVGNLLEDFESIRLEFADAPLGDEFFEHIKLIATLKKPERFKVLDLFDMEIRSIGFHPRFPGFEQPKAAIIIGGQIEFGDVGDVLAVEVDFHRLYVGLPKNGELLPQTYAKGLRVEIASGGFKIAGRVDNLQTSVIDGFAGEGTVAIPGLPELSAAFSFVKLRATQGDPWERGWFIAVEAARISLQIGPLPLFLRQIGLGFGYRYTSVLIEAFESEDRLGRLIDLMLEEISGHHSLARIDSWAPDPDRGGRSARWSIGLEGMFSMASANATPTQYNQAAERKLRSVLLQVLMFLRSDLTFIAAAKLWYPVSADDFFEDRGGMRRRPLALGFLAYSAPKSRLLVHAAKGRDPYLGPDADSPGQQFLAEMLDNSHFEATFLSEPGLARGELGWPDRLFFRYRIGALEIECRGGVLFQLERDLLIQGVYFSARGAVSVSAGVSLGIVGARITADISVAFAMRLMFAISLSRPLDSMIYAAVGIDVSVAFSVHVWFRLKLRFFTIKIDLRFRLEIQIVVALEIGWAGQGAIGFKAQASVRLAAFGRGLKLKIRVGAGSGVDAARQRLSPYMDGFLEPGGIPPIPGIADLEREGGPLAARGAETLAARGGPGAAEALAAPQDDLEGNMQAVAPGLDPPADADPAFVLALREGRMRSAGGRKAWVGWIMPTPRLDALYPVADVRGDVVDYATLTVEMPAGTSIHVPDGAGSWTSEDVTDAAAEVTLPLKMRHGASAQLEAEDGSETAQLTLLELLAACHVPEDPVNYRTEEDGPFPQNWKPDNRFPLKPVGLRTGRRLFDDRLDEPDDDARSPRRALDTANRYDQALQGAIENPEREGTDPLGMPTNADSVADQLEALTEQALGNQAFLFRGFADDMAWLAERVTFDGETLTIPSLAGRGRPTLADLGMAVVVIAETCPEWLCRFRAETPARLGLASALGGNGADEPLFPVVDFHDSNFARNNPDLREVASQADDETLLFSWTIDWPDGPPGGVLEGTDIEDFLDHYDVQIYDDARPEPLERATLRPCDVLAPAEEGAEGMLRLATRFQYVRKMADLLPDRTRRLAGAVRFRAHIVPVAQDGSRGEALEPVAVYRASATPLPADGAALRLHRAPGGFGGTVHWRQPLPPNDISVAATARWELVLRPVVPVPLGAYPHAVSEAEEQPLAGTTRLGLKDGDVVVVLDGLEPGEEVPDIWHGDAASGATLSFADDLLALPLPDSWDAMVGVYGARLFDHRGDALDPDGHAAQRARGFFDRRAATREDGAGWRLLLRPCANALDAHAERLPEEGYGALVRVPILLAPDPDAARVDEADVKRARFRALDYLEWPEAAEPWQLASSDLRHDLGALTMAAIVGQGPDGLSLVPQPRPGDARAVTLTWNAAVAGAEPLDAARFEVFEARLDRLVNADGQTDGFALPWRRVRSVQMTDRPFAGRATTHFAEPHAWAGATPVHRETVARLVAAGLSPAEMERRWPAYYSWRESELIWPPFAPLVREDIAAANARATQTSLLAAKGSGTATDVAAALHALGAHAAKRALHPWLCMVVGALSRLGAPARLGGAAEARAEGEAEPRGRFDVEVAPGKPGPVDPAHDPIAWMQGDLAAQDPAGWGALHHLGLSVAVALRDPVTGLHLSQGRIRRRLDEAAAQVEAVLALVAEQYAAEITQLGSDLAEADAAGDHTLAARHEARLSRLRDAAGEWRALARDALGGHVAIDLPVQTAAAIRADGDGRVLDDAVALSMVQLSLRPTRLRAVPCEREVHYGVLDIPALGPARTEGTVRFPVRTEAAFLDRGAYATETFARNEAVPLSRLLREGGGPLLLRSTGAGSMADIVVEAAAAAGVSLRRDVVAEKVPVALRQGARDVLPVTPFGVFDVTFHARGGAFDDAEGAPFAGFLDHLVAAFASGADVAEAAMSAAAIRARIATHERRAEIYATWSDRFFAAAPIPAAGSGTAAPTMLFDPGRLTATTPLRTEPALLAPDDLGRMVLTHPIEEDWASLRAYAVRAVPRYWDLLEEGAEVSPPVMSQQAGRVDVAIPRRRPVLAPKLLGARVLTDGATGRHFHEITTAEHFEQALSRSSAVLARKLEFQDMLRHFSVAFAEVDWLERLVRAGRSRPADEYALAQAARGATGPLPSPALGEADYLSFLPMARFGANRMLAAAEPFYYRQSLTQAARAVAVASPTTNAPLPRAPAAAATPHGGSAPVEWVEASWDALGLDVAPPEGVPAPLAAWLRPKGPSATLRFPRLLELLEPESLTSYFAAETGETSYGRLPDPQSRLEIVRLTRIGRATLATVAATPDAEALDQAFARTTLGDEFHLHVSEAEGQAPGPIIFAAAWVRRLRREGLDLTPLDIGGLAPLAQLAPIAIRLRRRGDGLDVLDPFLGPRALFRPSIPANDARPARRSDVASGLRLLLHPAPRAVLAAGVEFTHETLSAIDRGLVPALSQPLAAGLSVEHDFEGHMLWHMREASWTLLKLGDAIETEEGDRLLIVTAEGRADGLAFDAASYARFVKRVPTVDGTPASEAVAVALESIAALAEDWMGAAVPATWQVVAHHGNLDGANWGEQFTPPVWRS